MMGDKEAGEVRSGNGDKALAMLRLEEMAKAEAEGIPLLAGGSQLTPVKPEWMNL